MEDKNLTPMEIIIMKMIDRLCSVELDSGINFDLLDKNVELDFDTKYHIARKFINDDDIFDMIYEKLIEYIEEEVDDEDE